MLVAIHQDRLTIRDTTETKRHSINQLDKIID